MKKRILALLLTLGLLLAAAPAASAADASPYSDVPAGHWAAGDIARATELGLFQGVGGGRFGLGQTISRAEFTTALVRFFGWPMAPADRGSFDDVGPGQWYAPWVETALEQDAIAASGTAFRPEEPITRAELVEMLIRGMGYTTLAGQVDAAFDAGFTDVTARTAKRGFIIMAADMGLVGGVGEGCFAPEGTAAREEAAAVLVRAYDRWYTDSQAVSRVGGGYTRITVPTPKAEAGTDLPLTPLEPRLALYEILRTMRMEGQDMSKAVLCLTSGGVETRVSNGRIASTTSLTADEVAKLLASGGVTTHYSESYQSAYLIYRPNAYQTATVWYQSEESCQAKLQLARLFGVTKYIML